MRLMSLGDDQLRFTSLYHNKLQGISHRKLYGLHSSQVVKRPLVGLVARQTCIVARQTCIYTAL